MAVGLSGSNGGIGTGEFRATVDLAQRPLEVSYFVNNVCNLSCRHCYVGYEETGGSLDFEEWTNTFDALIEKGALTFGNVGKEPLLTPNMTFNILRHLKERRESDSRIRFGIVTNGTLLDPFLAKRLAECSPDYVDVSLDGRKEEHDFIRGSGNFEKTVGNLEGLPGDLAQKVFLSFTLMNQNRSGFSGMVKELSERGFYRFLVSPFVSTPRANSDLGISEEEVVDFYGGVVGGRVVDFSKMGKVEILLKSDYDAQKGLMEKLVEMGVINPQNLLIDEYGTIFNQYRFGESRVSVNYMPVSDVDSGRSIRISHDGYVGGCLEMFHRNYPELARANLKETDIREIIGNSG